MKLSTICSNPQCFFGLINSVSIPTFALANFRPQYENVSLYTQANNGTYKILTMYKGDSHYFSSQITGYHVMFNTNWRVM